MARLPGYIGMEPGGGHLYVRLWHPGFWVAVWREVEIEPRWLKPALFAYIMIRLVREH